MLIPKTMGARKTLPRATKAASPLPLRPSPLSIAVQKVRGCEKVLTAQGRGRLFLRLALQEKVLVAAVRQLAGTPQLLEVQHKAGSRSLWVTGSGTAA